MTAAGDPIDRARQLGSAEAARELYDDWAASYDQDVFDTAGVTGSHRIADLLVDQLTDRSVPILDIGCGTGVVGRHLTEAGCTDITGIDLSPGMLAAAERTGAYQRLVEADLTRPLDHLVDELEPFGASVSAGTFTTGHVTSDAVPRLLALHRPVAIIAWTISPATWPAFRDELTLHGVTISSSALEPIRHTGDDRSHMVLGTTGD